MAGIGFELRKVVEQRGLTGFLKASLAGTIIVAGPWLISIIGITIIQRMFAATLQEVPGAFTAAVIYCYAFSLILGGGFHYIFTRIISDYLYNTDEEAAFCYLLKFLLPVTLAALAIGVPAVITFSIPVSHPRMYAAGVLILFVAVNLLWFIMLFISVLKWYMRILLAFTVGMGTSIILLLFLGNRYGTGGAILGFALGHITICAFLLVLGFTSFKPKQRPDMKGAFKKYTRKYKYLFLTGVFYCLGIWIDKIVNWIVAGCSVTGTFLSIYEPYDITVYFANLSMIPGLIYFVVSSETTFYILLKKFLISLGRGRFSDIQRRKYKLIGRAMHSIREQTIFQGLIAIGFILASPILTSMICRGLTAPIVMRLTFSAVFFHLLYLTLLNFLFYLEMYRRALYTALIFFTVNIIVSSAAALISVSTLAGLGYLCAGIAGSTAAFAAFRASIRKMDRLVLAGLRY